MTNWLQDRYWRPLRQLAGLPAGRALNAALAVLAAFTVVDARPPRTFSFRWTHPADEVAAEDNSLLVTFDLTPSGRGTLLRMTESGFRERGWEVAVLEEQYREHVTGWAFYLPRLAPYVATLAVRP